jgi:hypothetical protein
MRILFLSVIFTLIAGCDVQTYDDCILKHMKDVKDQTAAILIRQSCLEKYPNTSSAQKQTTEKKCVMRQLSQSEVSKVKVNIVSATDSILLFEVYNGTENTVLHKLKIAISGSNQSSPNVYQEELGLLRGGIKPLTVDKLYLRVSEGTSAKTSIGYLVLEIQGCDQ